MNEECVKYAVTFYIKFRKDISKPYSDMIDKGVQQNLVQVCSETMFPKNAFTSEY